MAKKSLAKKMKDSIGGMARRVKKATGKATKAVTPKKKKGRKKKSKR